MQNCVLQIHEKMHEMQNFSDEIMDPKAKSSAYQVLNTQNAELCAFYPLFSGRLSFILFLSVLQSAS